MVNFHGCEDGKTWERGDIKIFLAHLIAMGLFRKGCLEKYWDHGEMVKTQKAVTTAKLKRKGD